MPLPWMLKARSGSSWVNGDVRRWTGTKWVTCNAYYYDGSSWVLMTDRSPATETISDSFGTFWNASYDGNGNFRTSDHNFQGNLGDAFGQNASMYGYGNQIKNALANSTAFYYSQLILINETYPGSNPSTTAWIGTHNTSGNSRPGTFQENRSFIWFFDFARGQQRQVDLGNAPSPNDGTKIMGYFKAGTAYGFTLNTSLTDFQHAGQYYLNASYIISYETTT